MAKILIVDDSMVTRRQLSRIISSFGHEVAEASNGLKALETLKDGLEPDCIFLDLLMPEMDGYEVLARLQQMGNTTPIYVVSADVQRTSRERVLALGAANMMRKPAKLEEIEQALSEALASQQCG